MFKGIYKERFEDKFPGYFKHQALVRYLHFIILVKAGSKINLHSNFAANQTSFLKLVV